MRKQTARGITGILLIFVLALIFFPLSAPANIMPVYEKLQRAESDHFIYIYQVSLAPQVPDLILLCEEAYALLTPRLHWKPRGKTIILYADSMDEHNGSTTIYPRPTILLYAAGSTPGSSIYEPGLFLRRTILHEYAHVLSTDAQYGTDAVLSAIFGRLLPAGDMLSMLLAACAAPPGFLAPTWYLEGLAIWAETEFSNSGRGRTSVADMIMRMPFAERRILPANRWDLALPEWPYGEAAYLYGMKTIEYAQSLAAEQSGRSNLPGDLSDAVAHSFLYFFDTRAKTLMGMTFGQMTRTAMIQAQDHQQARIARLQAKPLTQIRRLTPQALQVDYPRFGADGSTVFFSGHPESGRDVLYRYDLKSKQVSRINCARTDFGSSVLSAPPDHSVIYYTRLNVVGRDRLWNELHRYDPVKSKQTIITRKGRYRYPAISPDSRKLAAVRNAAGRFELVEAPLNDLGNIQMESIRAAAPPYHSIVDPAYAPDGKQLVYVLANDAHSQLRSLNLASGQDSLLVDWSCIIMTPVFHPSGKHLVFVADRNGVYNLYKFPLPFGEPQAITHVLGGVFAPDFSPDGRELAVASYDAHGYYLGILDTEILAPVLLPGISPDWPSLAGDAERFKQPPALTMSTTTTKAAPASPPGTNAPAIALKSQSYNSITGIRLDYWTPWLTAASSGGAEGGLAASCSDYTQAQNLFALGGAESKWGTPIGAAVYRYSAFYPICNVYGNYGPESYYNLVKDQSGYFYDYNEKVGQVGGSVTLPLIRTDYQWDFSAGYQATDRKVISKSADDYKGRLLATSNLFEGTESALFAQMTFFSATAFGRSASFEDGRAISATIERTDKALGGDLTQTRALGQWVEYLPVFWADNHVLRLEGVGAVGGGDETAQSLFGLGGYGIIQQMATPGLNRNVILRGYNENSQVGRNLIKAGVAYRFPLVNFYKGVGATLPFYMHQLFAELYYEGGHAWAGETTSAMDDSWLNAAGLEVNLSLTMFRYAQLAPGAGVVYAFNRRDPNSRASEDDVQNQKLQLYLSIKAVVNF